MALALLAPQPSSHPFHERQISLKEPIKIGRAVAKAKSSNTNGIFDCKVLSRNHAVMWYENGKFMIQDTKSSNGTYVNSVRLSRGSEESEPCEIKSGDTLQFGIEVVENSKHVTHGCIVGLVTLFNEDGSEAASEQDDSPPGLLTLLTSSDQNVLPQEVFQLAQFLQDALHREQMLENKLATLQRMLGNAHLASEDTFQGFIQEDRLLSRLETLENQLEIVSKDVNESEIQSDMVNYQDERLQYESSAKETLQRVLKEKIDVLQKCGDMERLLSNSEDEYTYLKTIYDKSQESLQEMIDQNKQAADDLKMIKEEMSENMKNHDDIEKGYAKRIEDLKILLEEAERRGSSAAVEVESLKAESDFTKEQLQAMKERFEQLQDKFAADGDDMENGDMDMSEDLPFASDNATLEKDVKNKSAYIQNLKKQMADVVSELENERQEVTKLKESLPKTDVVAAFTDSVEDIEDLQEKMSKAIDFVTSIGDTIPKGEEINLLCASWDEKFNDFKNFKELPITDKVESYSRALSSCISLMNALNADLQSLSMVVSRQTPASADTVVDTIGTVDLVDADGHSPKVQVEELQVKKTTVSVLSHADTMTSVDDGPDEVGPDQVGPDQVGPDQVGSDEVESDDSQSLIQENQALKIKISLLETDYNKLKESYPESRVNSDVDTSYQDLLSAVGEYDVISDGAEYSGCNESEDAAATSTVNESSDDNKKIPDFHGQLLLAQQSITALKRKREAEEEAQNQKQNQLVNLVMMLFILMVVFGSLIMLDIIKISYGSAPIIKERTWAELWEYLF